MNKRSVFITGMLVCIIVFLAWKLYEKPKNTSAPAAPSVFALSVIDTLNSKELGEKRIINVYLPQGYNEETAQKYPVIYVLDGGVEEDFVHITGLVRYNNQPWIDRFPKSIVVGIENTNRRRDFSFPVENLDFVERMGFKKEQFSQYGGSAKYIAFLAKELQPFIEKKYRASSDRTVIGESFAGLLATEILLKHRSLFNNYIIMSPSLWWGNESLLHEAPSLLKKETGKETKVYIGACQKEEDAIMYEDAVALSRILEQNGGNKLKVYYDYLPDEVHATIMHQGVYNAFKLMYPKTASLK